MYIYIYIPINLEIKNIIIWLMSLVRYTLIRIFIYQQIKLKIKLVFLIMSYAECPSFYMFNTKTECIYIRELNNHKSSTKEIYSGDDEYNIY